MHMCIFCDIINGTIPSSVIYEDDTVIAFLDISQVTKGHTLVVPKKHCDHFLTCEEETLTHLMKTAKMLAAHLMEKTGAKGMNILSNIGEAAGQSVPHFHVHLIPRYDENDALKLEFCPSPAQDLGALCKELRYDPQA